MIQTEAKFKRRLTTAFKTVYPHGTFTYVGVGGPGQKRGFPDLFFIVPSKPVPSYDTPVISGGHHLWIEAKIEGNPLSRDQVRVIRDMRESGCMVWVVTQLTRLAAPIRVERSEAALTFLVKNEVQVWSHHHG